MPETILGMPRRVALWVIGGAVLLVVVVLALRGRSASSAGGGAPASGGEEAPLGGGGPGGILAAQPDQQSGYERSMQELALSSAEQEAKLFGKRLAFEEQQIGYAMEQSALYQEKFLRVAADRGGFKCPTGKAHIDPASGQMFCREEQSKGFIGDYITPALGRGVSTIITGYAQSHTLPGQGSYGTPPIVPGRY